MNTHQEVWFVSGSNNGIRAAIATELLAQGYRGVAAVRKTEKAQKNIVEHPNLLIVALDASTGASRPIEMLGKNARVKRIPAISSKNTLSSRGGVVRWVTKMDLRTTKTRPNE